MATYSSTQHDALQQARQLLSDAGLNVTDLLGTQLGSVNVRSETTRVLSAEEILSEGRVTREHTSSVHAIIEHAENAIIEFPETGSTTGLAVAHVFPVDPNNFIHPKDNTQYSLGDNHGQRKNVRCYFLQRYSKTGLPVACTRVKTGCRSIKYCSFAQTPDLKPRSKTISTIDAAQEVFLKTLAFFCALDARGCRMDSPKTNEDDDGGSGDSDNEKEEDKDLVWTLTYSRTSNHSSKRCAGKFVFEYIKNRPLIRCEHYKKGKRGHLVLRNLGEFNLDYLEALLTNDSARINSYELMAQLNGYGPLVPCTWTTYAYREQKEKCPSWHRDSTGTLRRGDLIKLGGCPAHFEIYKPNDLNECPYVLMVCRNPHAHPNGPRVRTPESICVIFENLMYRLDWRLADAMPRRLLLDNGFMSDLRNVLNWKETRDPTPADLHPSLANHDHTGRLIEKLRLKRFSKGTGLEGAEDLMEAQSNGPPNLRYVRYIKEHEISDDGTIHIVICMFPSMSRLFHKTKRPSFDTSFKRLQKWQEFEIEAWFPEFSRSIVLMRAFITSQSAEAHQILFREIFGIVKEDTGQAVQFRHIHGDGLESITADGHSGQALGLGLYLQEICKDATKVSVEWNKPLKDLIPTEHLACIYRSCFAHVLRNINNLKNCVSNEVRNAMISLASAEPLPDYEKVLNTIRNGGTKAANWLKDKESSNKMALAAIYRPLSKIPIEIWKAAPATSNGNEQAHRNINRDGTRLTLLAGIMYGLQYDSRALQGCAIFEEEGIYIRDQESTPFRTASRRIRRKERAQQKIVEFKDSQISEVNEKIIKLQKTVVKNTKSAKHALESESPKKIENVMKRLRQSEEALKDNHGKLEKLVTQGSGRVVPSGILPVEEVLDTTLLDVPCESDSMPTSPIQSTSAPTAPIHPHHNQRSQASNSQMFPQSSGVYPPSTQFSQPQSSTSLSQPAFNQNSQVPVSNPYPVRKHYSPPPQFYHHPSSSQTTINPPHNLYFQTRQSYHPVFSQILQDDCDFDDYPLYTGEYTPAPSSSHNFFEDPFESTQNHYLSYHRN